MHGFTFRRRATSQLRTRSWRRPRRLSPAERLEGRVLLAADIGSATAAMADRLTWNGIELDVRRDAWVVTAPAAQDAGAGLAVASGWQTRALGEGLFAVTAPGASADEMLAWAGSTAGVEAIEPDVIIASRAVPNDPSFGALWGLENIGQSGGVVDADIDATQAWDVTTGSRSVVVAVIDSGVDYRHVDLADNMWRNPGEIPGNGRDDDGNGFIDDVYGWDFANGDGDPFDDEGHGTHVAGTIGAVGNNGRGVVGVNWEVSVMALKFLDADGSGSTSDAVAAINYATRMRRDFGVNVVATNNSWGGGGASAALQRAIAAGGDAGILFVAAAGNESANNDVTPSFPANDTNVAVLSVAATDRSNRLANFSNYGATTVDIAAPGAAITSTVPGNRYASYSGTSMAAPHVAGAVALLAAARPQATSAEIRSAILSTAAPVPALAGKVATGGLLNVAAAVQALLGSEPPAEPEPEPPTTPEPPAAPDPEPPVATPFEPNDAISTATPVTLVSGSAVIAATIGDGDYGRSDVDLYAVTLPAGAVLTVDVDAQSLATPSPLDSYVRVFDASGRWLAGNDDADGSLDSRVELTVPAAGTYVVGVSSYGNTRYAPLLAGSGRTGWTTGDYRLRFDVVAPPLTADILDVDPDPRTTAVDGVLVDFSSAVSGFDAADLALTRDGLPVSLAGATVSTVDGVRWTVSGLATATLTAGRYTLALVADGSGIVGIDGSRLAESVFETWEVVAPTLVDAGDSLRQAAVILVNDGAVRLSGVIGDGRFASRDVDLYQVRLAAGQTLSVDVFARSLPGGSTLDSYLRVFDRRGRQIAVNDDAGGSLDSALSFTAGRTDIYFIGVSGYGNAWYRPTWAPSGWAGSTGVYQVAFTFGQSPAGRAGDAVRILGTPDGRERRRPPRFTAFATYGANWMAALDATDGAADKRDTGPVRGRGRGRF